MTAASMTPGWYAERTPDVPAIIMGSSGETVTYAQLEERSVRLARVLRSLGAAGGRSHRHPHGEQPARISRWPGRPSAPGCTTRRSTATCAPAEVQYILDDCGAAALVTSPAMADVVAALDLSRDRRQGLGGRGSARLRALRRRCWPVRPPIRCATSPKGGRCCTRRGRPGSPRGCASSCPAPRWATRRRRRSRSRRASTPTGARPTWSTCRRHRSTTRRRSSTRCRCSAWARRSSSWSASTRASASS